MPRAFDMRLRVSVGTWRTTLLATIGLAGCGGSTAAANGTGGPAADSGAKPFGGGGAANSSGGASARMSTGGSTATGGAPLPTGDGSPGGSAGRSDASRAFNCDNPEPVPPAVQGGPNGGLVRCSNGAVHRPSAADCSSNIAAWHPVLAGHDGGIGNIQCTTNTDCTEKPNGYCVAATGFAGGGMPGVTLSNCAYGCVRDADCGAGQVCLCGDPVGSCVEATCNTDSDCLDGACIELGYLGVTGCGYGPTFSFGCWRPDMTCTTPTDCPGGSPCNYGKCQSVPVCGRPFLVEGVPCRAEPKETHDWAAYLEPAGLTGLDAAARAALTRYWTEVGLMEHASIAAFSRFALELMALGAPPSLLEATMAALRDETHHARLAFGLASAHCGTAIGPGPIPMTGALVSQTTAEIVATAFLEACVGETCAALEAAEAAERATDPAAIFVLRRIAADETRHAELGWRFVKWALATFGADVREAVEDALRRALWSNDSGTEREPTMAPESDETLARHGVLCAPLRAAVRAAAMQDAVVPCARALLGTGHAAAA